MIRRRQFLQLGAAALAMPSIARAQGVKGQITLMAYTGIFQDNYTATVVEPFQKAFPDTRHTIEDLVAEGDRVAARISACGTHTGELFGQAPTGRVVTLTGITIYRLVDGRIVERWAEHGLGILDQLGISPPVATAENTRLENAR